MVPSLTLLMPFLSLGNAIHLAYTFTLRRVIPNYPFYPTLSPKLQNQLSHDCQMAPLRVLQALRLPQMSSFFCDPCVTYGIESTLPDPQSWFIKVTLDSVTSFKSNQMPTSNQFDKGQDPSSLPSPGS